MQAQGISSLSSGIEPGRFQRQAAAFHEFFVPGRVFECLHVSEAFGPPRKGVHGSSNFREVDGKWIYIKKTARHVVIKVWDNCVNCAEVHTYRKQGTNKPGVNRDCHVIFYDARKKPEPFEGEEDLLAFPVIVRVDQHPSGDSLVCNSSRVNFSRIQTFDDYVWVRDIGVVDKDHIEAFLRAADNSLRLSPSRSDDSDLTSLGTMETRGTNGLDGLAFEELATCGEGMLLGIDTGSLDASTYEVFESLRSPSTPIMFPRRKCKKKRSVYVWCCCVCGTPQISIGITKLSKLRYYTLREFRNYEGGY